MAATTSSQSSGSKRKNTSVTGGLEKAVAEHHNRFLSFLSKRVESSEAAEEILQAAYLKGLKQQKKVRDNEKITAWFYRLLRNAVYDHYRHKAAEKRALERLGAESEREQEQRDQQLEKNVCQCVNRVMKTLKPEYAEVLQKAEVEDESIKELAKRSRSTPSSVSVRLHRARLSLKKRVLETCGACAQHGCLNCSCK